MNFTCRAESNANEQTLLILLISIEFGTFEVWLFQGVPEKKLFKSRVASQKIALLFRVCVIYH